MKKGLTELVFILDKSGSMDGLEADTIGGYNSVLSKQKDEEGECIITTVLFDNHYELLHDRIDIRAVKPITRAEYFVGGSTALLDAIGITVNKISSAQEHTDEDYRAEKVMFVIVTDGEENSSREFSSEKVKALIERKKAESGWEFIFLGANIDAVSTARSFGIAPSRAANYVSDPQGTAISYAAVGSAISGLRQTGEFAAASLDAARKDAEKRGKKKR
jgi:uncharacterized protein YegL